MSANPFRMEYVAMLVALSTAFAAWWRLRPEPCGILRLAMVAGAGWAIAGAVGVQLSSLTRHLHAAHVAVLRGCLVLLVALFCEVAGSVLRRYEAHVV